MKVKYQIFVSSTYEDLKEERELAIKAILEMGHIPVGMEMFSAGDEEQWKVIQKQIDDCDYYIVIVAHRYGSLDGTTSYTEKEYDYAFSKKIPTLGFIIDEKAVWPITKLDTDFGNKSKLDDFKSKIKRKHISFWTNKDDLYGKVSISLMKQFSTNPREGWVKANELTGPEVVSELSRLSKENSELRQELERIKLKVVFDDESQYDKLINALKNKKAKLSFYYKNGNRWEEGEEISYFKIFEIIASELMVEESLIGLASYICLMLKPQNRRELRKEWPIPSNYLKRITADFNALDILVPSTKKHSVNDTNEYWSLTENGKKLYKIIRKESILLTETLEVELEENE